MNRIDETFKALKAKQDKALIGYLTAGYPDKKSFEALVPRLVEAGLDMLEIGIAFSDPIADGPVIQQASQKALDNGVTLDWTLQATARLRQTIKIPFIFMSYCNPIYAMGLETFFKRAKESGVDGLIVPDLIPDVAGPYEQAAQQHGIHLIYLASPTSPKARLVQIAKQTRGFLYVVSLTGVTGARADLPKDLGAFVVRARGTSRVPVAVGFGISTPAQAKAVGKLADGVIVGSALIKAVSASQAPHFSEAISFVTSLKKELRHAS